MEMNVDINIEKIRLYFEILGYMAGVASVLFLAFQLRKERKLEEYKMLQGLEEKYTTLLWKGADQAEIDRVWKPLSQERQQHFDSLKNDTDSESWDVWNGMTDEEQNCYRFTRAGFEILEQAFIANKKGWVDDAEIKKKWDNWMISWKTTNTFAPYVFDEMQHWFTPSFVEHYKKLQ